MVSGSQKYRLFYVNNGGYLHLSNLTIASCDVNSQTGGAIYLTGHGSTVTMNNVRIVDNVMQNGHGIIYAGQGSTVIMSNVGFVNNIIQNGRGIVYATSSSSIYVTNSAFLGNRATYGGVFALYDNAKMYMNNSNGTNNSAILGSGGVFFARLNSEINIKSSSFTDNYATISGGVLAVDTGASFELDACQLRKNFANVDGGGISSYEHHPNLLPYTFFQTKALLI